MQPSSPTPHSGLPAQPLLSSPLPRAPRRNKLRLGSSSEKIQLVGLADWRRQPKASSRSKTSAQTPSADERSKAAGNDARTDGVVGARRSYRSTLSGNTSKRPGSGLGMGMQSTPAKKRKTKSFAVRYFHHIDVHQLMHGWTQSIGAMSTPKASSAPITHPIEFSDTDVSVPSSDQPVSSADESLTSPSIATSGAEPIPIPSTIAPDETQLYSSRSARTFGRSEVCLGVGDDPFLLIPHDFFVPLNDRTYTSSRPSKSNEPSATSEVTAEQDFTTPRARSTWDFVVPLNDVRNSSTSISDDHGLYGGKTPRVSTPRPISGEILRLNGESQRSKVLVTIDDSENSDDNEAPPERARSDAPPPHTPMWAPLGPIAALEAERAIRRESPKTPSPNDIVGSSTILDRALYGIPLQDIDSSASSRDPATTPSGSGKESVPSRNNARSWQEPFGLIAVQSEACGRARRWYPSSEEGSPPPPRSPSPISFPTSARSSITPNRSESSAQSSPTTPSEAARPIHRVRGAWRGARVLARIEGREVLRTVRDASSSDGESSNQGEGGNAGTRRKKRAKPSMLVTQMSEAAVQARQTRIKHYQDLANNYRLRIEYVLG